MGWFVGSLGRSGVPQEGPETLREVWNASGPPPGGSGRVKGKPTRRSGTGRRTLPEGPGLVGVTSGTSGTGWETLGEIRDGLGDPWGGLGRVGEPSEWSRTGLGTLGEVKYGSGALGQVQDGSSDPRGGPGRGWGPLGRSGTGQETLRKVWDGL